MVKDNTLTIMVYLNNGADVYTSTGKVNDVWKNDTLYFKAGLYLGVNQDKATGYGQVSFYGLDYSHTPGLGLNGLVPAAAAPVTPPASVPTTPAPSTPASESEDGMKKRIAAQMRLMADELDPPVLAK